MPFLLRPLLFLSLVANIALIAPAFAYGPGGDGGGGGGGAGLSNATTKKIVRTMQSGIGRCQRIDRVYWFDCYRQTYRMAAKQLNGRPAYTGAQEALISVEKALDQIMARHGDPARPNIRKGFQTYRPIKPTAVPRATAQLTRALDQAETVLLRAPDRTGTHFARIAEAVNSSKVLLRSRLYPDGRDLFQAGFA